MFSRKAPSVRQAIGCRAARMAATTIVLGCVTFGVQAAAAAPSGLVGPGLDNPDWNTIGHDPSGTRSQPNEQAIGPANVDELAPKWIAPTTGDVSGTPAVVNGAVYFGDFGGTLQKVSAATGAVIWSDSIAALTGIAGDYARSSPSVDGNVVVVGTNKRPTLLGIDATTGAQLWSTQVNPDDHGTMTGSPVLVGDTIYTGVSASGASGPNATFQTDMVAVDALTGRILWQTYVLPPNGTPGLGSPGGYAGATMFSAPAVDVSAGLVYGTFGQPYTEPASVKACNVAAPNGFFSESCEQPGAHWDSIVAFDMSTGEIVWSHRIVGDDAWNAACAGLPSTVTWCLPENDTPLAAAEGRGVGFGDAWDLGGSSPNVFRLGGRDVVGVGEKSGVYVVLDAKTGDLVWNTLVGPGGDQGGFEWGSAYDGSRLYVSLTDHHHIPYQLTANGTLTSTVATGGSWAALDPATGKILWQTADPQTESVPGFTNVGVWDLAPVSVANGVVYVASMAKSGNEMYGLDAATGKILWSFSAGSSVNAAPAIVGDSIYWGSGYSRSGVEGSGNNNVFAFTLRPPGNVSCVNQVLTGLVQGNLTVPDGDWCDLTNNVHITGNLLLKRSSGIRIVGAEIDGNLEAMNTAGADDPSSPGANIVCATTVKGNLEVHGSSPSSPWTICGNTIGGNLEFHGNASTGNVVSNNTVGGNLHCRHNGAVTGGGNVVHGIIRGQCSS